MIKQSSKQIIRPTEDGSSTIYSEDFDATYHSTHGALAESNHVFMEAGIDFMNVDPMAILELGFGTGLNAILSYQRSKNLGKKIDYTTLEAFPVEPALLGELQFDLSPTDQLIFEKLHELPWGQTHQISDQFSFRKHQVRFEDFTTTEKFDLVFHDAFGPGVHPEVWESPFLDGIYQILSPGAVLVTFCAKGSFKRALRQAGFEVQSLEGPVGKREMTRALKSV